MEHPEARDQKKTSRVRAISVEYEAAASGFVVLAWIGDVPWDVVAAVIAFLLAGWAASVVFDQLSGIRELPDKARNMIGAMQSGIIGTAMGVASMWGHEYIDGFGMGMGIISAFLAGVCIALIGTAWRQRRSERQLYREMLLRGGT